jgi:hypothetical protein
MTISIINRRTAAAITAALVLGTAGPAAAYPIGDSGPVQVAPPVKQVHYGKAHVLPPFVPRHMKAFREATAAPVPSQTPRAVVSPAHNGGNSEVAYIVVGGVLVALGGLGGTLAVAHRRRTAPTRPRVAA